MKAPRAAAAPHGGPAPRRPCGRRDGDRLQQSAPPSLGELVALLREWITEDERAVEDGEPTPDNPNPRPVSRYIAEFDAQVLAPLRADLDSVTSPARLAARLAEPHERLAEAQAVARAHEDVAAWFEQLEAMVGEVIAQAADLEPSRPAPEPPGGGAPAGSAALRALGAVLPALRSEVVRPSFRHPSRPASRPASGRRSGPARTGGCRCGPASGSGSDLGHGCWRRSTRGSPTGCIRRGGSPPHRTAAPARGAGDAVTAAPFGAMAPLRPVQDERGA
ncbi:hypothetical protein NKH18_40940 [Streptomyces sp. M10(2022)]